MKTVVLGRWACGWTFFLLFHFLYCGYSILFCEIKRNHGVYMQLNSDSKAEWGIWETSMLLFGLGQYRVSTLCSAWGKGRSEKPHDLSKDVWGYQVTDRMRLQAPLLKSPGPSCLPWPLIPRSLPSLGNSVLNKTKRWTLTSSTMWVWPPASVHRPSASISPALQVTAPTQT